MSHVLVKWQGEATWDVYPVRALTEVEIAYRLLSEENAIHELRGAVVNVNWETGEPPAPAELLDSGTEKVLERKRTRLARTAMDGEGSVGAEPAPKQQKAAPECNCGALRRVEELEAQVIILEERLKVAKNNYDSYDMVKNLRKIVRELNSSRDSGSVAAEMVNIGGGVLVEKSLLDRLHSHCRGTPAKFARSLVRNLFTKDELRGKSLFGKGTTAKRDAPVKEGLDPVRVNAIIGYTCSKFDTSTIHLKNSLSSMLAREIK
ncbi:unnamed protein product [Ixodes hexagonus]